MKQDVIDQATQIIETNSQAYDSYLLGNTERTSLRDTQPTPEHFSWVHLDVEAKGIATDSSNGLTYHDAADMKEQVVAYVRYMLSPDLLELIRTGQLLHLTVRIGPCSLAGVDMNEEFGIGEAA